MEKAVVDQNGVRTIITKDHGTVMLNFVDNVFSFASDDMRFCAKSFKHLYDFLSRYFSTDLTDVFFCDNSNN